MRKRKQKTKQFVVYEVWTRAYIVEATSETEAYREGEPAGAGGTQQAEIDQLVNVHGLNLSNWQVIEVPKVK